MYWTPNEVRSEIFSDNISKSTVLALINKGEIPAIRLGHKWYIPRYWVEKQLRIAQGPAAEVTV